MKRFCLECGTEAQSSDSVCTECGTVLPKQEQPEKIVTKTKTPMTKKNKILTGVVVLFVSLLVGFYMYGNSYASAESTLKRFQEAVVNKDQATLKKLVQFENGIELTDGELDAIIAFGNAEPNKFAKSIGPWGHVSESFLFAIKQTGKVFGLFNGHKLIVPNQLVSLPYPYEELEYTLNGEKLSMTVEDGRALIGPLAPGIYELKAEYKGEYAEFSQTKKIEVLEPYGERVHESLEFDISQVTFDLDYPYGTDPSQVKLVIGESEIAFDEDGYIEALGPFPLDGSIKVKTVSEFPWGLIESEEIGIEETYMYMNVNGIDKDVEQNIVDTVVAYGEQYIVARAAANTKDMSAATDDWKKVMQEGFDYDREYNRSFSGQLDEVQANFDNVDLTSDENTFWASLPVSFSLQSSTDSDGKDSDLKNELQSCTISVVYVDDEWKVDRCQGNWYTEEAGGTIVEGSKKLHKAGSVKDSNEKEEDATASKDNEIDKGELESFMQGYNLSSVEAINENDFSLVSDLIVSGSPREKEQKDYLGYLDSKGITEDHISTTLNSFKSIDDTTVEVTTKETFNLHYPDKDSAEKTFTTVSQLKLVDGEWLMYKLVSTK